MHNPAFHTGWPASLRMGWFGLLLLSVLLAALFGTGKTRPAHAETTVTENVGCSLTDLGNALSGTTAPDTDYILSIESPCTLTFGGAILTVVSGNITIEGNGATITGATSEAIVVRGGTLTLDNVTLSGNTLSGNANGADQGTAVEKAGAIYIDRGATVNITNSTIANNTVHASAIDILAGSASAYGGAIYNDGGTLAIANTTFWGNKVGATGTDEANAFGGAIDTNGGTVDITNSTFSGNAAVAETNIGAPQYGGGAVYQEGSGAVEVVNSIFVNNPGGNCVGFGFTVSNNLSDDYSCLQGTGTVTDAQVNLGPLADNGGPTETMLPGPGSAAIDAGNNAACEATGIGSVNNTDQRGIERIPNGGAVCDIGAVEIPQAVKGYSAPTISISSASTTYGTGVRLSMLGLPTAATGTVAFTDGQATLCTANAASGGASCTTDTSLPAGAYPDITGRYGSDSTYYPSAAANTVSLSVDQASLTVIASSGSMTYGGKVPDVTASYSGFVNGETAAALTTQPTCSTAATSSSPVVPGGYPTSCTGAVDPNYAISYVHGDMQVEPATLTVTADDVTRIFGAPNPVLSASFSGFVNGDSATVLSGTPSCTTTAVQSSPVGTYPITCTIGTLSATNYIFSFAGGTLTVTATTSVTGSHRGPLTVGRGEALYIGPGAMVSGPVTVSAGGGLDLQGGSISGPIRITGGVVRICGATISGALDVSGSTVTVVIGDDDGAISCAGSAIDGPVRLVHNSDGVEFDDNTVRGPLTILDTTGLLPAPDTGSVDAMGDAVNGPTKIN